MNPTIEEKVNIKKVVVLSEETPEEQLVAEKEVALQEGVGVKGDVTRSKHR